ncbi:hypothetical protein HETIRDRAFT_174269 [Heterobasidion irregulare TC 32-1]|uniref:WD40 repeat-like protein n=1 Tax=Heterobasidion irregulare (strain TC 32-1) TaxID=747525 RepID=W4JU56_HETIT|nr:uncharacterized protein HETIRDRAFT_174269 [Heterobasidion irregulare TC 32-1]ETW77087.1 hypothetical protein HETIRDRAFT_174269 [Heterobasidion irregulare TC 32-1]
MHIALQIYLKLCPRRPHLLRAFDLPKGSNSTSKHSKFCCVVTVDEKQKKTEVVKGLSPEWNESFSFDAHPSSILKLDIFAYHRVRKNQHIGGISEPIDNLCPSILDGGNCDVTKTVSGQRNARVELRLAVEVDHLQTVPANLLKITEAALSDMHVLAKPADLAIGTSTSAFEPVTDLVEIWTPLLSKVQIFCQLMDGIAEILKTQIDRDDKIHKLFATMNSFYDIVSDLQKESEKIDSLHDLLQRIAQQTTECCYFIRDYAKTKGFVSDADDKINGFCAVFDDFKSEFYGRATVKTQVVVTRILNEVQGLAADINLDDIPYANDASFDETKACQVGTRVQILDDIAKWVNEDDAPRILFLSGAAGTGKSAIAHTIAHRFKKMNRLGSSFCFVRGRTDRGPDKLFSTVARDLADFDQGIRCALHEVVKDNKALRVTSKVSQQFDNLLLKPLEKLTIAGPLVIVIDALDECGDAKTRKDLLRDLAHKTKALPTNFRILLTSRPEADIEDVFHASDHVLVKSMEDLSSSTEADINLYINAHLGDPDISDIDNECKRVLVAKCEGLFQWASVACEFIKGLGEPGSTHRERFDLIVQGKTDEAWPLDSLYRTVLDHLFRTANTTVMNRFKLVMSLVLTAFEPLSVQSLEEILRAAKDGIPGFKDGIPGFKASIILRYMGSLLSGVAGKDGVRPLHTSFRDFLLDPSRSADFYIDTSNTHAEFTVASLSIMKTQLSFNVCHLKSSHVANKDIPDLADRIDRYIPAHLSYCCRSWVNHLDCTAANVASEPTILKDVEVVLTDKLLFWLEVMSLLRAIPGALQAMSLLTKWSLSLSHGRLSELTSGARAFLIAFGSPMLQSTPHVYLSALPFAPQSSTVFKMYAKDFPQVLRVSAGADKHWSIIQDIIHARSSVSCITFSPDGLRVVSGSEDSTIRLWDAATGAAMGDPLEGHTERVKSVAFSPDGLRIVSGSDDSTIRLWDVVTGAAMGDPLKGHTETVNSVAFSPDGLRIASGSEDSTIRLWDVVTGAAMGDPLEGHTGWVNSVAFSPDGLRIVSGSSDRTIRLWDAATGAAMGDPLEGHTDRVKSVAFSPDGLRIASGSDDWTIRLWDAATGAAMGDPLEGHTDWVNSVAFSPDGLRIVSGSSDSTIRLWDAATGAAMGDPLEGHIGWVNSVAFSPDGLRIVSGSDDSTIRLWDVVTGAAMGDPLEGHTDRVNSVAFSPDGLRIVSGSSDLTIRLWDAATGAAMGDPLEGHTGWVNSVAFSPDGLRIVSGSDDSTIRLWDAATGAAMGDPLKGHTSLVTSVAFSPDGLRIVSGSSDLTIRLWDAATGAAMGDPLEGHTDRVNSVAFSPDGLRIVSGSDDLTIRLWDVVTGAAMGDPLEGHTSWVTSVAFSPDGLRIASGSLDRTIWLWDVVTGAAMGDPLEGHTSWITSVAFSPDGLRIASGSFDKTIRLWDVATGTAMDDPLDGHTGWVDSIAFSPDGLRIVSGSFDKIIRVWDVTSMIGEIGGSQVTLRSDTNSHNTPTRLFGMDPVDLALSEH